MVLKDFESFELEALRCNRSLGSGERGVRGRGAGVKKIDRYLYMCMEWCGSCARMKEESGKEGLPALFPHHHPPPGSLDEAQRVVISARAPAQQAYNWPRGPPG
jgi:hypothetical protein